MDFNTIPKYMNRYSFASKMSICQKHSIITTDFLSMAPPEKIRTGVLPWELEAFVLFAVNSKEYNYIDISEKQQRRFKEIISAIRGYDIFSKLRQEYTEDIINKFVMHFGMMQFEPQEYQLYKFFRYNWFFNYRDSQKQIDLKKTFYSKFNVDYEEVWQFAVAVNLFIASGIDASKIIDIAVRENTIVANLLSISRSDYRLKIKEFTQTAEDYPFCVNPSSIYIFIMENGVLYLPLPHLLCRATTSSFFHRLTDDNLELKSLIGKNVIEAYLLNILSADDTYEEVLGDRKYHIRGTESYTPDVMIKSKSRYLFIECKLIAPSSELRIFNKTILDKYIDRVASAVYQVYKQMELFINGAYNFFKDPKEETIKRSEVWGIVSILEDSYIGRESIYKEFARIAKISLVSQEYNWVINHIKIVSLYNIETYAFVGNNIIDELITLADANTPYDYALVNAHGETINQDLLAFFNEMKISSLRYVGKSVLLSD